MLSELPTALRSETLVRNDFRTIWNDRVLNRAYEAFGGVPQVNFKAANPWSLKSYGRSLARWWRPTSSHFGNGTGAKARTRRTCQTLSVSVPA